MAGVLWFQLSSAGTALAQAEVYQVPCWPGAQISLAQAIQKANAQPGEDTISIQAACDVLITVGSYDHGAGATAMPLITDDVIVEGNGAMLRRLGDPAFRLLQSSHSAHLTLRNVTLKNGRGNNGGALYAAGPLTLIGAKFVDNHSPDTGTVGGAVLAYASLTISNCSSSTAHLRM